MHMCLVERDIYRTSVYVSHYHDYLPEHEWKGCRHGLMIFTKIAAIFDFYRFVNALSQEPLVRITHDFLYVGIYPPDHEMELSSSWYIKMAAIFNFSRPYERVISRSAGPNQS